METFTEITHAEAARRQRAARFESLQSSAIGLRAAITRLERDTINVEALRTIHALCADVPPDLVTRGGRYIAGGYDVRDLLMVVAGNALADVERKEQKRLDQLAAARIQLAEVETELQTFE